MNEGLSISEPRISPFALSLSSADRAALKSQRPWCLWLTGLSGAGKSTLANALEVHLNQHGLHDSPYEAPLQAECEIDTQALDMTRACQQLAGLLYK